MMDNKIKAILFDFGGVLAEEGFKNGLEAIANQNRIKPVDLKSFLFDTL